jgi:hypothetical protein
VAAQRVRSRALRLEVEQLAALVAQIGDDDEQQSRQGEADARERRDDEREQRTT